MTGLVLGPRLIAHRYPKGVNLPNRSALSLLPALVAGVVLQLRTSYTGGVSEPNGYQPCIAIPLFLFMFGGQFWENFSGPA